MKTTLREQLDLAGYDWSTGVLILQGYKDSVEGTPYPGWAAADEVAPGEIVPQDHPLLDYEYDNSFGAPTCPRFVARDTRFYYFPWQYDGATGVERVSIGLDYYLQPDHPTPYPGG